MSAAQPGERGERRSRWHQLLYQRSSEAASQGSRAQGGGSETVESGLRPLYKLDLSRRPAPVVPEVHPEVHLYDSGGSYRCAARHTGGTSGHTCAPRVIPVARAVIQVRRTVISEHQRGAGTRARGGNTSAANEREHSTTKPCADNQPRTHVGRTSWSVSRVLFPGASRRSRSATIHLGAPSPARSSGSPAGSGGQPSDACARPRHARHRRRFQPCSGWGLPSRAGHPARWWSLTPPFHPYLALAAARRSRPHGRSVLCGTFPRLTPGCR